jgi:hypothetical protein
MTGDKFIIKFEGVALRCLRTKQGLKLEGAFFSMQFMFLYATNGAYMYTEQIPRPVSLFYDVIHIVGSYLELTVIPRVELAMDNDKIENYIAALAKSTDPRFKELADMVSKFKWKQPSYESVAGNLAIHWYSDKAENQTALKIIARFREEYAIRKAVLLEVRKGYDQVMLLFCGKDVFYDPDELTAIEPMLADVTRITYKFIVKVERGDSDVARSLDISPPKA